MLGIFEFKKTVNPIAIAIRIEGGWFHQHFYG